MAWRLASTLDTLRSEINVAYPRRSKVSDGTIGDAAHQAQGSSSDHNPWISVGGGVGVVSALDITTRGPDDPGDELAELLRRDPRTKYVIRNGRISHSGGPWLAYTGSDLHDTHMHLSVLASASAYDSSAPWGVTGGLPSDALQEDDDMYTDDDRARDDRTAWMLGQIKPQTDRLAAIQAGTDTATWALVSEGTGLRSMVAALAVQLTPGTDVDEAAIADAVIKGLPDGLARTVLDGLRDRLAA